MGTMSVMDKTGDEQISWDPRNDLEVRKASDRFTEYLGRGYKAYRVNHRGGRGEQIMEFDPMAYEIIFHKIMAGG